MGNSLTWPMRPPASDVALYRGALRDVNTLAQRDLLTYWRTFDLTDANVALAALVDVLPGIIADYHLSAATVAADWYDIQRSDLGVKKRFAAVMAKAPTKDRGAIMARWAIGPMYSADPVAAAPLTLSKVSGGLQRVVLDGARDTIVESTVKDPTKVGWARVGSGRCDFCAMLIGRGAVYSESTADFASHDHCGCSAVPDFG